MPTIDQKTRIMDRITRASSFAVTLVFIALMVTISIFTYYLVSEKPQAIENRNPIIITSLDNTMTMAEGPNGEIISFQIPSKELTFWWQATLNAFYLFIGVAGFAVLVNQIKKRNTLEVIPSSP